MVKIALEYGASVNDNFRGIRVLHIAIHNENHDIVSLLLSSNANPFINNDYGKNAFYYAKVSDFTKIKRLYQNIKNGNSLDFQYSDLTLNIDGINECTIMGINVGVNGDCKLYSPGNIYLKVLKDQVNIDLICTAVVRINIDDYSRYKRFFRRFEKITEFRNNYTNEIIGYRQQKLSISSVIILI